MKCVMLMFDSLNRHMLPPYGGSGGPPVHAPNFARLAERTAVFDRSYICSMPCMPARRDLHTGRPNFLHRSWAPIEPFDDSVPDFLREHGVYTHLSSDHYHYWEEGGANYHARYRSWEFFRGQEGDPWIGMVTPPPAGSALGQNASDDPTRVQDRVNRLFMRTTAELPQSQTVAAGIDFMRRNRDDDNWFLHMETFDPHEPFYSNREFKDRYAEHYAAWRAKNGPLFDWPRYDYVTEDAELVDHMRHEYAALVSMCDARLGDVLDTMDELSLWDDTMLIVWTDHGFLLGEHECWAKVWAPYYEEVSHTPFFVWDPRAGVRGERREALVQPSIDLGPTLLSYFGFERFDDMLGCDLGPVLERDEPGARGGDLRPARRARERHRRPPRVLARPRGRRRPGALRLHADAGAHAHALRCRRDARHDAGRSVLLHQGAEHAAHPDPGAVRGGTGPARRPEPFTAVRPAARPRPDLADRGRRA